MSKAGRVSEKGVQVERIGKSFGPVDALRDISFDVGRGEVVALLGPNGAGKTTTVEILSTLTTPDRGRATSRAMTWWATRRWCAAHSCSPASMWHWTTC